MIKKFITISLSLLAVFGALYQPVYASTSVELTANYNKDNDSILLDWNDVDNLKSYKIYQQKPGKTDFESISATDLSSIKEIKVLNVYPDIGNNLKTWMETNKYGKGIIKVTPVNITSFNSNPSGYMKNSDGIWKYDVFVLGFYDSNNSKALNYNAQNLIIDYINDGKGVIFGHDTNTSFFRYRDKFNMKIYGYDSEVAEPSGNWINTVKVEKKGQFTNYPWNIGEIGTVLTIPKSHNTGQVAYGDTWLSFTGNTSTSFSYVKTDKNGKGCANSYLSTYNNCSVIQTGHTKGYANVCEQKLLANLIFYSNQLTSTSELEDFSGQDVVAPKNPTVGIDGTTKTINIESEDLGSTYSYYVEALLKDSSSITSNTVTLENKSGLKGFYWIADNIANTGIMNATGNFTEGSVKYDAVGTSKYIHVAAVDNVGNISNVTHLKLAEVPVVEEQPKTEITDNEVNISVGVKGDNLSYQWEEKKPNEEWKPIKDATSSSLKVDNITNEDVDTEYRCQITNPAANIVSNTTVIEGITVTINNINEPVN